MLRGLAQCLEEIFTRGRAVAKALEMQPQRVGESLRAYEALEHREHLRALLIRDRIEGTRDLRVLRDDLTYRPSARQRIERHRIERFLKSGRGDTEIGAPPMRYVLAKPFGEAFAQPDVRPPGRGDEVAEPLMRKFVRNDLRKRSQLVERRTVVE